MKKSNHYFVLLLTGVVSILLAVSCKKSSSDSSAITVQNLAGTYTLTALTVTIAPLPPQNIIDSVPACQRDDQYKLNTDLTYDYIDAGIKCTPSGDGTGVWSLSGNTIVIDTTQSTIQKFDGRTLVINTNVNFMGIAATTTETLTKQ
ncbi:MAG TPA: lipocalin family protein [Puia sp.]|nr:lipocalin family protein [Puia sp.]